MGTVAGANLGRVITLDIGGLDDAAREIFDQMGGAKDCVMLELMLVCSLGFIVGYLALGPTKALLERIKSN